MRKNNIITIVMLLMIYTATLTNFNIKIVDAYIDDNSDSNGMFNLTTTLEVIDRLAPTTGSKCLDICYDGTYIYVAEHRESGGGKVWSGTINADGEISQVDTDNTELWPYALHSNGTHLAVVGSGGLTLFSINSGNGALAYIDDVSSLYGTYDDVYINGSYIYCAVDNPTYGYKGVYVYNCVGGALNLVDSDTTYRMISLYGDGTAIYGASVANPELHAFYYNGADIQFFDTISLPYSPAVNTPSYQGVVHAWNGYITVGMDDDAVGLYQFSGGSLSQIDTYDPQDNYFMTYIEDGYIYFGCGGKKIQACRWYNNDFYNLDSITYEYNGVYRYPRGMVRVGSYIVIAKERDGITTHTSPRQFNATRTVFVSNIERENFSFYPDIDLPYNVTIIIPVSTEVNGIMDVTNNTNGGNATEVETEDALVNNSFWYDTANMLIYIRTVSLGTSSLCSWTINCSGGITFHLIIPEYLEVGDYFHSEGIIEDSDGTPISGFISETRLLYENGTDALNVNPKWNCSDGNYHCTFSTHQLIPGSYSVSIEFTHPTSGITFKEGATLYLSTDPATDIHVKATIKFNFYNNNTGMGLMAESYKTYVSTDTTIDSTDRLHQNTYKTYTGATLYYRVDDYFDNIVYPTSGSYQALSVISVEQSVDVPIDLYSFSVKNMNHSIIWFNMTNSSRTYPVWLFPYEPYYFQIPSGEYNLSMRYYDSDTGVYETTKYVNKTITSDSYYWIRGYDLQDIVIEITAVNTSLNTITLDVSLNTNLIDSIVGNISIEVHNNLSMVNTSLHTLINNVWNTINITDSIIDYINNTVWNNLNLINTTVDVINNKINIDLDFLNVTVDYINTTLWTEFTTVNSNINNMENTIHTQITITESNLSSLITSTRLSINITRAILNYINNSLWFNLSTINTTVNAINNQISINLTIMNNTINYLNTTIWNHLTAINTTINSINNQIWTNFTFLESELGNLSVSISTNISFDNSSLTSLMFNVWNALNITNSTVNYLNLTFRNNFTAINSTISDVNINLVNTIALAESNITNLQIDFWHDLNTSLKNRSVVLFEFYNTNDGLGIPDESLKVYINDTRLKDSLTYHCKNGSTLNLVVKDYYNFSLLNTNITVSSPFSYIAMGLTFHSWLFGNSNDDYYMISLLKQGASRWWERGITPHGGEREFIIPTGNYTLRIYDKDYTELYNSTTPLEVRNSKVYVIYGNNLTEVISGLSVVRGKLLEIRGDFEYALTEDVSYVSYNPPIIISTWSKIGMLLGQSIWTVCPPLNIVATTKSSTYNTTINTTAIIPGNGTLENGTITILEDTLYIFGSNLVDWVNITYTDNGTLMQNTTYIPSKLDIAGQNLTIRSNTYIRVDRETTYNQLKKFNWTIHKYAHGPLNRPMHHQYGFELINDFDVTMYDVYIMVGFTNKTTPDPGTVSVYDETNDRWLESSKNFKITDSGIDFKITGSLPAGQSRRFTFNYYSTQYETLEYGERVLTIRTYQTAQAFGDKLMNKITCGYTNQESKSFRGNIVLKLDFDNAQDINNDEYYVKDEDNNIMITGYCTYTGGSFIINSEAVGTVEPGQCRDFIVYFLFRDYPGANPTEYHMTTALWAFGGLPVTLFLITILLSCAIIGYGVYRMIRYNTKKNSPILATGLFMFTFIIMITIAGV